MESQSADQAGLELGTPPASASLVVGLQGHATTYGPHYFLRNRIKAYTVFM